MLSLNTSTTKTEPPPVQGRTRHLLTPLPEPGEFLFVVDNSAAERFVCPTLAKNYLIEGREPHPTNAALNFGGALHVGIETLLKGPLASQPDENGEWLCETPTDTLARASQDLANFLVRHPSPLDEYRTVGNALQILAHYQRRCEFPDYALEIQSDEKGLLVERPFELPLGVLEIEDWVSIDGIKLGAPDGTKDRKVDGVVQTYITKIHVAWAGRIDVIARCLGHNDKRIRVIDHKTTSQGDADFIEDFHLSSQSRGYVWAAQQLWPELNITGFCLDAIKFKKPAAGCGIANYGPKGGKPALELFRSYFDYTPESITDWAHNQLTRVEDFIHCLVRGEFPMETTYCFNRKYGKCAYHDVCVMAVNQPEAAKAFLHSPYFRPVTWNPTDDR